MTIQFDKNFSIGEPGKDVYWEYGVETCSSDAFLVVWSEGNPVMPFQESESVKGCTDTAALESFLYAKLERYIQATLGYSTRDANALQVCKDPTQQTISMAMPFDHGNQYVVGALKYGIR